MRECPLKKKKKRQTEVFRRKGPYVCNLLSNNLGQKEEIDQKMGRLRKCKAIVVKC